jgi:hypothetical protein
MLVDLLAPLAGQFAFGRQGTHHSDMPAASADPLVSIRRNADCDGDHRHRHVCDKGLEAAAHQCCTENGKTGYRLSKLESIAAHGAFSTNKVNLNTSWRPPSVHQALAVIASAASTCSRA